jgi:hypothetical protein
MALHGLQLSGSGRVERVRAIENRGTGIKISQGLVIDSVAINNGADGISCTSNCTIDRNTSRENAEIGISCGNCTLTRNAVYDNGEDGISCSSATIADNTSAENGGDGIRATSSSLVRGNVVRDNLAFGLDLANSGYLDNMIKASGSATVKGGSGAIEMGPNVCNGDLICP